MVSEAFKKIFAMIKSTQKVGETRSVEQIRDGMNQISKMSKLPDDVKLEEILADEVDAVWITTPESSYLPVIVYMHGGGYISGSPSTHYNLCSSIARVVKGRVISIDYRLAPEHPFPAALDDAIMVYKYLLNAEGISPDKIIFAGDSAGGGLVIATLLKLKEIGEILPRAVVCFSPWVDLMLLGNSFKTHVERDPFLTPEVLKSASKWYCGQKNPKNPLISPLYGDLKGLPPILIQVGTEELLLDDSVRLAKLAKEASVDVTLEIDEGMIHVYQAFVAFAPEPKQALDRVGEFLKKQSN
ncbi:MAG: alpha/beta hydrolase [Candidatus Lokiarchaeota archaeon]|nr:alpha/beta hydrolase [Candidatus Lokiarchaeota archaeon]